MKKAYIIVILLAILSFSGSFYISQSITKPSHERVPVVRQVAQYTALQSFAVNITGTVAEVGSDYLVISDGKSSAKVKYQENGVSDFRESSSKKSLKLTDVKIGDKVHGGVTIIISPENAVGLINKAPGDIIAHNLIFEINK